MARAATVKKGSSGGTLRAGGATGSSRAAGRPAAVREQQPFAACDAAQDAPRVPAKLDHRDGVHAAKLKLQFNFAASRKPPGRRRPFAWGDQASTATP
ncbi:MAG TPA: hypothetical protein PKE47_02950, partial [Verrucomicrobiota bacterium]|nr:hypothetical protein [Verrucomicrobiota bacterium]